ATAPLVKDVKLTPAAPSACSPDAYFSRTASCGFGATVDVDWGTRDDNTPPTNVGLNAAANFHVEVNGVSLLPPGANTPSGIWSVPSGLTTGASGSTAVQVKTWWKDTDNSHKWNNQA